MKRKLNGIKDELTQELMDTKISYEKKVSHLKVGSVNQ